MFKSDRLIRTKIAIGAGIAGGLVYLLFFFFFIGLDSNPLYLLLGLLASVILTSLLFLFLNYK